MELTTGFQGTLGIIEGGGGGGGEGNPELHWNLKSLGAKGRKILKSINKQRASQANPVSGLFSGQTTITDSDGGDGPPDNIKKGSRVSLHALAGAFCETIKRKKELTVADFAKSYKIIKRRIYDVTNVLVALNLISFGDTGSKIYKWNGEEGMIKMCRDTYALNTDELIVDMFESKAQYPMQQTATFLVNFYLCGHFRITGESKKEKAVLLETIQAYMKQGGLASKYTKVHIVDSTAHSAYRRVYDVLNVFSASGFYSCADALIRNGTLGPRPPVFTVNSSLSSDIVHWDRPPRKIKNGESRLSYIKKDEFEVISALVNVRQGNSRKKSAIEPPPPPPNKRIRTRSSTNQAEGGEELIEDTLSQSLLSLKRRRRRRNDELAISAAASAQEEAEAGVPQEWISMDTSSLSTGTLYSEGHCDALMEVLYTSPSDHFKYLPLLDDEILFGGAGATTHMTADEI